ncbi:peptidylprolyl isomerase [Jeotgalibacillus alimentarius]|uniref:peptidylprolyl isomerase n=1 Tax=Jeotgalibacillus alimentarius TaxID=135826 RepID=A0A0C2SIG2_9BACL|nr:peptidyl-prolyl cis-trans isomerase [Jeotgalibacillus alimentarius]KIL53729.1 peptidylprolyl isomerase [Jeotgalibacillus alimentarius]
MAEIRKRRLKAKPLLYIIGFLMVTNLIFLIGWITKDGAPPDAEAEVVAQVGDEEITRQEWLHAIEVRHGKEILQQLINQSVMEQSADKYDVAVSEEELDQELSMLRSVLNVYDQASLPNESVLKEELKTDLILEKLIATEAEISEEDLRTYYDENEELYSVPEMYRLSQIVLPTAEDAAKAMEELENGSSFEAVARERSIDPVTASQGGQLGFIPENTESVDAAVLDAAASVSPGEYTDAFQTPNGYTILFVHETVPGVKFEFEEVRGKIERQLALEKMTTPVTAESFWDDYSIDWFYGPAE